MGINSLRYLDLCGVKWELKETLNTHDFDGGSKIATVKPITHDNPTNIIPPTAPINASDAQTAADTATDLKSLMAAIENFNHPLRGFARHTVPPHFATSDCGIMIITDAPSGDDDESGAILTGAAGELMDKMLGAIGLSRDNVSIVPLVFWRTPGGRGASRDEMDIARPFVMRAISLMGPKYILTLGTTAAAEIANAKLPKDHGIIIPYSTFHVPHSVSIIPIYHPNYLMLKPDAKRDVWETLQNLQNLLKTL